MSDIDINSTIISYQRAFDTLSSVDGTLRLDMPIEIDVRSARKIRLIRASISSTIPNVFRIPSSGFNNGLVRASQDGGVNWTAIQLPNGVYSVKYIEQGINNVISAWYTDPADPAVRLQYNLATTLAYVKLDSSKLAAPGAQIAIDFSQSRIWELLGFVAVRMFLVDGIFGADANAQLDWFGNNISVIVEGLGGLSYRNGSNSYEICQIPLTANPGNEYLYPTAGIVSPILNAGFRSGLDVLTFKFQGTRTDVVNGNAVPRAIYILEGGVNVTINLLWSPVYR